MFSLERKSDYRLQLSRTLKEPGHYKAEVYLFTPYEGAFSEWTLTEKQFYFSSLEHNFRLQGLPDLDRATKTDGSFSLLSPHYEIIHGSWLFQYRATMDRLRLQMQTGEFATSLKRALRISQNFAQRLRKTTRQQSSQKQYFRNADMYFSWYAEQFILQCMTMEGFSDLDEELKNSIQEFLQQEYRYRHEKDYLNEFQGNPTRIWNRMSMYLRLLEYPVLLRKKLTELGSGTRKMVKAVSTILIMSLFTYVIFILRDSRQELSVAVLLLIALIYAVRDLLRDDMTESFTEFLRKGKPRWRIRLLKPYVNEPLALQKIWMNYRKLPDLSLAVREYSDKWSTNDERQIICYRSELSLDKAALDEHQIEERLALDCKELCELIQSSSDKIYIPADPNDPSSKVQSHTIEKQHDYNLLVVYSVPGEEHTSAQRWQIRLGSHGIVKCKSKKVKWPSPEEQRKKSWWRRLRERRRLE